MRRSGVSLWALVGCLSATAGWLMGGLVGSFPVRIAAAVACTAAASGWLLRSRRLATIAPPLTALVAVVAYWIGLHAVSPLLAWPAASATLGVFCATGLEGRRGRAAVIVLAPLLGTLGLVLGLVAVAFAGMSLNDSRWVAELLLGGAAGFGLGTLGAIRAVRRWAERAWPPAAEPVREV